MTREGADAGRQTDDPKDTEPTLDSTHNFICFSPKEGDARRPDVFFSLLRRGARHALTRVTEGSAILDSNTPTLRTSLRLVTFDTYLPRLGMTCFGAQTVLIRLLDPSRQPALRPILPTTAA